MTNNRQHNQVLNKATKALLFVMLFVFAFAIFLATDTPILSDNATIQVADAMTGNQNLTVTIGSGFGSVNLSNYALTAGSGSSAYYYVVVGTNARLVRKTSNTDNNYFGWEVHFTGNLYYAFLNGAIGTIDAKLETQTNDGASDGRRYRILSSHPSWNNGTVLAETSHGSGASQQNPWDTTNTTTGSSVHKGTNEYILYNEFRLSTGIMNNIDTTIESAWLDIYRTDTTNPYCTTATNTVLSKGSTITLKDDNAGVGKAWVSYNGGAETALSLDFSADSSNHKTATATLSGTGTAFVRVEDNVGNSSSYTYYVFGPGTAVSNSYALCCRNDFVALSSAVSTGTDFSGTTFSVEPNTENGQTAYSAGGTTIVMGAGAPNVQFSDYSLYTGISSNYAGNGGEEIGKLFDGNTGTKYCTGTGNAITFYFNLPSAVDVTGYYWATGNDTASNTGRNPAYFRLYGSNDGTNWTKLDDRSNGGWTTANQTKVDFSCNTATGFYKYFKVETKANGASVFQISEFGLRIHQPFTPIGNNTKQFKGNVIGNGCTVSGLSVVGSSNYAGLFGYTNGSTISNLTVSGGVSGTYRVGALVGDAESTTISNCNATNVTISGSQFVGGLVGYANGTTISTATVSGAVTCTNNAGESKCGGIAGNASGVAISNSTNSATVTGTGSQVGGIVGYSDNASSLSGTITNLGKITGVGMVGGIGGQCHADQLTGAAFVNGDTGNRNSATVGNINGSGDSVGGLFGFFDSITGTNVSYTNFGTVNSSSTAVGGIVGRVQCSLTGAINFGNIVVTGGNTRTGEVIQNGTVVGGITGYTNNNITNCTNNGSITATNGTVIGGIVGTFSSTLITFSNNKNYGTISAKDNVGGIVGFGGTVSISSCTNNGVVTGSGDNVGGVAGNSKGTVSGCTNSGAITGSTCVGGVVGRAENNEIKNCINSGYITATSKQAGGILGDSNSFTKVNYCYNEGSVNGALKTGGIVGNSQSGTVSYCYNYCYGKGNQLLNGTDGIGGIIGFQTASSNSVANSWTFYTSESQRSGHNSGLQDGSNKNDGYIVLTDFSTESSKIYPARDTNDLALVDWNSILTNDIKAFRIFNSQELIGLDSYLSISSANSNGNYIAPDRIADHSIDASSGVIVKNVFFNANKGISLSEGYKRIYISKRVITFKTITLTYTGDHQIIYLNYYVNSSGMGADNLNWWQSNPTDMSPFFIKTEGDDVNAGNNKFKAYAEIRTPATQLALGITSERQFNINKADAQVLYGGTVYGAMLPELTPEYFINPYTNLSIYKTNSSSDNSKVALFQYPVKYNSDGTYAYDDTKTALANKEFVIGVWNGTGTSSSSFAQLVKNGAGTDSFTVTYNNGDAIPAINQLLPSGVYDGMIATFSGANINTFHIHFSLIMTDFDKFGNESDARNAGFEGTFNANAAWGSAQNPYVISSWVHMVRLMEIVNGDSQPINSVAGQGICQGASITQPASYDISYENGNFFVTANSDTIVLGVNTYHGIDLDAHSATVPMKPIGTGMSNAFAGNFDGNGKAIKINLESNANNVGLFGFVKSALNNIQSIHDVVICGSVTSTSDYSVGALAGQVYGNARVYNIKNYATVSGKNWVGGIIGFVGDGVNLGSEHEFSTIENYGAVNGDTYVGGIAGLVYPGAGVEESANTYVLGANTGFVNMADNGITATGNYVGGIFGGMYADTNDQSYDYTRFQPAYARNVFNVTGSGNYVGGLFGSVQYNQNNGHIVYLINTKNTSLDEYYYNQWSYNGSPSVTGNPASRSATIKSIGTGTKGWYVGGIAGQFEGGFHQLIGVFNTARIEGNAYVGGIAGQADNGRFENCFVTNPDGYTYENSEIDYIVSASGSYVGGMFGYMLVSATVVGGIVQNYNYDRNGSYQGGLVGYTQGAGSNITGYAVYLKGNASYTDTLPSNNYGSYIIIDKSIARLMTVRELFVYAGLRDGVTNNKYSASISGMAALAGNISLGANLPEASGTPNSASKMQVVFYDTNKTERKATSVTFDAANNSANTELYLRFATNSTTAGSFIVGIEAIEFDWNNVLTPKGQTVSWQDAYLNTAVNRDRYQFNLSSVTIAPTGTSNDTLSNAYTTFLYHWNVAGGGNDKVQTSRTFNLTRDTNVDGVLVSTAADWANFCTLVKNGTSISKVTILNDFSLTDNVANVAGDFTANNYFGKGKTSSSPAVLYGNNHTITVVFRNVSNSGFGLFPYAANAEFNDLTIQGILSTATSTSASNISPFVGLANGNLTFNNCTNRTVMDGVSKSSDNYGGFIGGTASSGTHIITFNNCVNDAYVHNVGGGSEETRDVRTCGTGGFIGCLASTGDRAYLNGCRNTGNITGGFNVGGMVGRTHGYVSLQNCGNTGNIIAMPRSDQVYTNNDNTYDDDSDPYKGVKRSGCSTNTNAGGLLGMMTDNGRSTVFGSYNTGNVHGYGNKAGGIMAADCERDDSSNTTQIYYCYNTGNITTGGDSGWIFSIGEGPTIISLATGFYSNGCQAGGILGVSVNVDVQYCYNIGTITGNGVAGATGQWDARVGGIVGYSNGNTTFIRNSYNVGQVVVNSRGSGGDAPYYAGGILGQVADGTPTVTNCYSLHNDVVWNNSKNNVTRRGAVLYNGGELYQFSNNDSPSDYSGDKRSAVDRMVGTVLSSIDDFTAKRNSSGTVSANTSNLTKATSSNNPFDNSCLSYNASTGIYTLTAKPGWIYIEGCLPQLAIFAVDTRDGLAMTAANAGTENMPFVIKDGIDLMGLEALTNMGWSTVGKYFETANENNNLEKDVAEAICLPTTDTSAASRENWYKFQQGSTYKFGNNYHLFATGAVYPYMTDGKCNNISVVVGTGNVYSVKTSNVKMLYLPDVTKDSDGAYADQDSTIRFMKYSGSSYSFDANYSYNFWRASQYVNTSGSNISKNGNYIWDIDENRYEAGGKVGQDGSMTANGNNLATGGNIGDQNFEPIAKAGIDFKGNFNGALTYDGNGNVTAVTVIKNINIKSRNNNNPATGGLFGSVRDGVVQNIAVTGNITAKSTDANRYVYVGIIGIADDGSTIDNVQAGTATEKLIITAYGTTEITYTGGIIGFAVARTGTLNIKNCKTINAEINGCNGGTGGIVGATTGGKIASTNIENCAVQKATITSSSGTYLGGIVGKRVTYSINEYGNLAIDGCYVGTNGVTSTITSNADAKVTIIGQNTIGGIISNAQTNANGSLTITNCTIFGDTLITRTANPANNTNTSILSGQLGTAIGGIAGFTLGETDSPIIIRGDVNFYGRIDVNVSSAEEIKNIGGLIGYMGSYSIISSGAFIQPTIVNAAGVIDGGDLTVKNIGGVAGISNGGALDGEYHLGMTTNTPNAISIGGFIGYNVGNTSIARTGSIESISTGQIVGKHNVGGFIGNNGWNDADNDEVVDDNEINTNAIVNIGASSINGALYGTDADKLTVNLYSSVDGKMHVGGFIGVNAGTVNGQFVTAKNYGAVGTKDASKGGTSVQAYAFGGIVGANVTNSHFNLTAQATFSNETSGQVGYTANNTSFQFYVGGILGVSMGELDIDPAATLSNDGAVYGYLYVGGAIGGLVTGTMQGEMENDGNVTGSIIVGGVFGIVMQGATIGVGQYKNYGTVTSTANTNNSIAGGVIGAMYGVVNGTTQGASVYADGMANFENYGSITAKSYSGGAIGLVDGSINNARFVNSASLTFTGGDSVGGVIGYITSIENSSTGIGSLYPSDASGQSMYSPGMVATAVTNTYFGYIGESGGATNLVAGASTGINGGNDSSKGGVGGVIGTIDANEITSATRWNGNSFFVNGNVTATSADAVGGVIGQIVRLSNNAPYITISNMLAYENTVSGRYYVGGIVGYNGSVNTNEGTNASISNCYKIRGIINGTDYFGGIVGGYYGEDNNNVGSPKTNSSYWVYATSNSALLNIDPNNIGETLTATWHTEISANDYLTGANVPSGSENWDAYIAAYNANPSNTNDLIQNAGGDWGYYTAISNKFSTGKVGDYTGYFFVYSNNDNCPVENGIDATHSYSGNSLSDIDYWKMIASTADAPDASASDIVSRSDNNGVVRNYTIYVTAKGAMSADANNKYYYLSIIAKEGSTDTSDHLHNFTVDNAGNSTVANDLLFVSIDATQACNVIIYYKPIYMANNIVYDGEEHRAPIRGLTEKTKSASQTDGIYYELIAPNGQRTINGQTGYFNVGTDAMTYDVDADIWFVSDDGFVINLGKVYSRKADGGAISAYQWRIIPKNLTLTPTWTTGIHGNNASVEYNSYHQGLDTLTVGGLYARDINTPDGILRITLTDDANVNSLTSNQQSSSDVSVTYTFSGAVDASTASGHQNGITYSVVCESNNGNYTINGVNTSTYTYSWTIEKKDYSFEIEASVSDTEIVYDGQYHNINISINGGSSATETFGNDTLSVIGASGSVGGETGGCDVGTYSFNPKEADVSGVIKATRGSTDVSYNYNFSNGSTVGEVSFEIVPATVTITWETTSNFVYSGSKQGPGIASVVVKYGNTTVNRSISAGSGATSASARGAEYSRNGSSAYDTLVFTLTNYKNNADAGTYTSTISLSGTSGTNCAGTTGNALKKNYEVKGTLSRTYTIKKSKVSWKYGNGSVTNINKVYDGTSAISGLSTSSVTFSSTNGGANAASAGSISGYYTSDGNSQVSAAGSGYPIVLSITLGSSYTKNYELDGITGSYSGNILKRGINITFNGTRIYKTYDTNAVLATLVSDVENSSTEVRSDNYRTGRGFIAKNFVDDGVNISFRIAEETADRTELDSSINGILKNAGMYSAPTASSKNTYLKQAVFTLDTTGAGANYYIGSITTTSGVTVYTAAGEYAVVHVLDNNTAVLDGVQNGEWYVKSTLDIAINPYNVQASYQNTMQSYANEDNSYNKNWLPVTATLNVPRSMISAGIGIQVINKWMFADVLKQKWTDGNYNLPDFNYNTTDGDPFDNARFINKYTQFSGSSSATYANNSTPLFGATITSVDGFSHLNLKLRNQPNVIIGYFIDREGYEISSLSGLLLATEYYKGTITPSGDETETVSITNIPTELLNYPTNPDAPGAATVPLTYPVYANNATTTSTTPTGTSWDGYVELYRAYILARYNDEYGEGVGDTAAESLQYSTYYYKDTNGEYVESDSAKWNFVLEYEREVEVGDYMDFLQIDNISGVFTQKDLDILAGEFGSSWGVGSTHLANVVYTPVAGSVVTFIGAIFDGTFNGSYSGNGYIIDHVNIIANVSSAGDFNAGMFAHVQPGGEKNGAGMVKGVHLRNANIQVFDTNTANTNGTINVGGIVGLNQSDKAITNSSFHGTIIVNTNDANAVVNVGGIVGLDLSAIESYSIMVDGETQQSTASIFGAIVIANIFATSANGKVNAGGIVGGALSTNSYSNVVSMSEIYAKAKTVANATVGGFVGNALGNTTAQTNDGVVTVTYAEGSIITTIEGINAIIVDVNKYGVALKDGVYRASATDGEYEVVNKVIGNNTVVEVDYNDFYFADYTTMYNDSNSLYTYGTNHAYIGTGSEKGEYDVIQDTALMAGMGDYGAHESMRLKDIIDIYVLLYEKNTITFTGADAANYGTKAYVKGDSWVAQGATGVEGNELQIAYRQHTSLLRMFNYMNFIVNRDITMAAEYGTLADITKTDNGENVVVSYVATPAKEAFFGNISGTGTINFRYKNTASSVLMFAVQDELLTEKLVYDNTVVYQTA